MIVTNYGVGGSHKVAFRYAIEQGFDYLMVLHGDDQTDVHELTTELERGSHRDVDCLLGARFMRGSQLQGYSLVRTLGNRAFNKLFGLVNWHNHPDLGSGLKLYQLTKFQDYFYKYYPDGFTFDYIMHLAMCHAEYKLRYFPMIWRVEDQVSNIHMINHALDMIGILIRYCLGRRKFLMSEMHSRSIDAYTGQIVYHHNPKDA